MKYGKTLKEVSDGDRQYGALYLQYKLLRKFLKEQTGNKQTQVLFMQMLDKEHARIRQIVSIKLAELRISCDSLLTNVHALRLSTFKPEDLESEITTLTHHADDLAIKMAALDKFVFYNKEAFRKIVKKHDKLTSISLSWITTQRRSVFVDAENELEQILVAISDIYKFIAENSSTGLQQGEHKVSDDTFERKSHKYWVALEDVFQFKVHVVKHLPLHFFARKRRERASALVQDLLIDQDTVEEDLGHLQKHGWITSIYMDSDELGCYKSRINMEEGATLFRVRWYGDPNDLHKTDNMILPRAPLKGLYYERKTHHESWVALPSTKERFPIGYDQVVPFMEGTLKPDTFVKQPKALGLAEEFQEEIVRRKLHPVIRTAYKRTAFQHDETNDVRITLDTQLTFVDENPRHLGPGEWKRFEEEIEQGLDSEMFSFAVLEVKLKGEAPEWLSDITNKPYIRQVSKFSKFQQASCTFNPHTVCMFPYWFTEEDMEKMKNKYDLKRERQRKKSLAATDSSDVSIEMPTEAVEHAASGTSSSQSYTNAAYVKDGDDNNNGVAIRMGGGDEIKTFRDPTYDVIDETTLKNGKATKNGSAIIEKAEDFGGISGTKRGWRASKKGKQKKQKKTKVATARVKVEPKTHFANERTFLQWLRIGMTLFSLGGVIFNLSDDDAAQISGLVFMCSSALILGYGLGMYYWRMWMINTRKMMRFDDKFGPAVLVMFIMGALVVNLVLIFVYDTGPALPFANTGTSPVEQSYGVK